MDRVGRPTLYEIRGNPRGTLENEGHTGVWMMCPKARRSSTTQPGASGDPIVQKFPPRLSPIIDNPQLGNSHMSWL